MPRLVLDILFDLQHATSVNNQQPSYNKLYINLVFLRLRLHLNKQIVKMYSLLDDASSTLN